MLAEAKMPSIQCAKTATSCTWEWQLAWCTERCHKQHKSEMREGFELAVSSRGGVANFMKKTNKFSNWVETTYADYTGSLALVTDWREAKPCYEFAVTRTGPSRPVCLIVLIEMQRCWRRAVEWVETLDQRDFPVIVLTVEESESVELIINLAHEKVRAAKEKRQPQRAPGIFFSAASSEQSAASTLATAPVKSTGKLELGCSSKQTWLSMGTTVSTDEGVESGSDDGDSSPAALETFWQLRDAGVVDCVFSVRNVAELANLLLVAAPDQYDD